jgi:hypothetical protein
MEYADMLAQGMLALSLVVRIYDAYDVPSHHLAKAKTTVEGIMKGAGVAVIWPRCPCLSPVSPGELVVRITASVPASEPGSLGFSFVDMSRKAGVLATVFADRVRALAAAADIDEAELLGRVIAHEISHLLLGTRDHGTHGLMRGAWKAGELTQQRPADWLLSRAEGRRIRRAVRWRSSESPPAMMAIDADLPPDTTTQ